MTKYDAKKEIEFLTNIERMSIDSIDAMSIIDKIYESIGTCKDCISRTEESGCDIYESLKPEDDWYCADFEEKK